MAMTHGRMLLYDVDDPVLPAANLTRPYVSRPVVRSFRDRFTAQRDTSRGIRSGVQCVGPDGVTTATEESADAWRLADKRVAYMSAT